MLRRQLFEFEDQSWFPETLRTPMTQNIVVMARWLGVPRVLAGLIKRALGGRSQQSVVDLGSGAGGVMPDVFKELAQAEPELVTELTLTDKFPNIEGRRRFPEASQGPIRYLSASVDATELAKAPAGLKTLVNCFHHMTPDQARNILASAAQSRQPLLIYEMGGHQLVPFALWCITLPIGLLIVALLALVKSACVRPFTWRQIVWTYLIPVLPLFYAWDGQASMSRIYRFEDLDELLAQIDSSGYTWERGYGELGSKRVGSYLLGLPDTMVSDSTGNAAAAP